MTYNFEKCKKNRSLLVYHFEKCSTKACGHLTYEKQHSSGKEYCHKVTSKWSFEAQINKNTKSAKLVNITELQAPETILTYIVITTVDDTFESCFDNPFS